MAGKKYIPGKPIVCPNCMRQAIMQEQPEGYATERWQGARAEEPYVQCPLCSATFPTWGIIEYVEGPVA